MTQRLSLSRTFQYSALLMIALVCSPTLAASGIYYDEKMKQYEEERAALAAAKADIDMIQSSIPTSKSAKQKAAEEMAAASGGMLTVAQSKEMIGSCSTPEQCSKNAQNALNNYAESATAAQLALSSGMPISMAEGMVQGCATKGGDACSQVLHKQGVNYLTEMTAQSASQYSEYVNEANLKVATKCASSGNSSQCVEKAKDEAAKELAQQAGLTNSEAKELMKLAQDPSKYAEKLQKMAEKKVQSMVTQQANALLKMPLGNTGLSISSLQNTQYFYQTFILGFLSGKGFGRPDRYTGLGQISSWVERPDYSFAYDQKNYYNPAVQDGALYYGSNNKDLSAVLKTAKGLTSSNSSSAVAKTVTKELEKAGVAPNPILEDVADQIGTGG